MYNTTYLKRNLAQEGRVWRRLWIFAKAKAPFLAHHGILIVVGYPIGVVSLWCRWWGPLKCSVISLSAELVVQLYVDN